VGLSRPLPNKGFGDQKTGHIKVGDKKEQSHESSVSLPLLCSVKQNVITEGNHPKALMIPSFRRGTKEWVEDKYKKSVERGDNRLTKNTFSVYVLLNSKG